MLKSSEMIMTRRDKRSKVVRTDVKMIPILLRRKLPAFLDLSMPPVIRAIVVDGACAHNAVVNQTSYNRGRKEGNAPET